MLHQPALSEVNHPPRHTLLNIDQNTVTRVDDTIVQVLDCLAIAYQRSYLATRGVLSNGHRTHISSKETLQSYDKEALNACSIVPKHLTATAAYRNAWRRLTTHQKTESGIHEQRIQNPVREIWNLHHGIQNPILFWNTLHEANYTSTTPELKTLAI